MHAHFPVLLLPLARGCALEGTLDRGDGMWQIAEYHLRATQETETRVDETLSNAGTIRFVTEYDDWGGQWAIVELPVPSPFHAGVSEHTELLPSTRWVLWDTDGGDLLFAWGADWANAERITLTPEGGGFVGTSTRSFGVGVAGVETWESTYVLVP